MTHCAISTFDNTLEEVCVIMSGNKDEKKQKKGNKNNSSQDKKEKAIACSEEIKNDAPEKKKSGIKTKIIPFLSGAIIIQLLSCIVQGGFNDIGVSLKNGIFNIFTLSEQLSDISEDIASVKNDIKEIKDLEIKSKLESYDESISWIQTYLMLNSAFKTNLVDGVSINMKMQNLDVILMEPKWTSDQIIAVDPMSNKLYKASELVETPLLIPYTQNDMEVYFLGKYSENNRWDGKCILNCYLNDQINTILEAYYDDGKLLNYKQVMVDYLKDQKVWVVTDRENNGAYNSGVTRIFAWKNMKEKNYSQDTVQAEYIYDVDDFMEIIDTTLLSYYIGNTSDGKYNDNTGNAILIKYDVDGTILTFYKGNLKNGNLEDNTNTAWEIARDPRKGTEHYLYYKGIFKDGVGADPDNGITETDIPLSRIFEIIQENNIDMELNWYHY